MVSVLLLLVGLALLIKAADLLVDGASAVARRFGVPSLIIGLTVVSFGTSLPEMLVTMVSGLRGNSDLAIANVIGSNIANVLLVLGVAAIIRPLPVHDSTVVSEIPFSLAAALLVGFLANAQLLSSLQLLSISRFDGVLLLFFFCMFMMYVLKVTRESGHLGARDTPSLSMARASTYIALGIVGLYFGGEWVVDGAVGLAQRLGINDAIIGLTIIAIGTSSPELVASSVAAFRNEADIAVGNVVGSNIFNLLWVLGATATVVELPFEAVSNLDLVMVIVSSTLIILALVVSRNNTIMRLHGGIFVASYVGYLVYVVLR
jgi:cation:H+ antiporter